MTLSAVAALTWVLAFQVPEAAPPVPRVRLANPTPRARVEVVRFSMPWQRGRVRDLRRVRVGEDEAPCTTLMHWPDGSVAVTQVHARVALGPGEQTEVEVRPIVDGEDGGRGDGTGGVPDLLAPPPLVIELEDAWGRTFRATLADDPAGAIESFGSTSRVVVRRLRAILERPSDDGAGTEALFAVQAWMTTWAEPERIELILLVDADPRRGELVTGPARFRSIALRVAGGALRPEPRYRSELAIREPEPTDSGGHLVTLIRSPEALYLGDRTGKAFVVDLLPAVGGELARLAVAQPIEALPDLDWVRSTGAFGVHGGPAPSSAAIAGALRAPRAPWWVRSDGGPLGGFDEPRDPVDRGAYGLPPSALHDLLRGAGPARLAHARLSVLQGALRPTPATQPRLPADTVDLRRGLSRRAIERPHGFAALDYEHFAVDLAHDVYWLTGDPMARRELARAGSGLLPLLRSVSSRTSRGEGACLRAGALIARATGDTQLLGALRVHVRDVLSELIGDDDRAHAIAQPPDARALGADHPFDVPWQMALLVHGLHAIWREAGDELARDLALRVARRLAGPCWIDGVGLAGFVSAREVRVRALAPGDGGGAQGVAIGAFVLAAELTDSEAERVRFLERADEMVRAGRSGPGSGALPTAWLQLYEDRKAAAGR